MGLATDQLDVGRVAFDHIRARDVMVREVQAAHGRTQGDVIASLMIEGFGGVPIVDEGRRLVGIVTEFDLLAALDAGQSLGAIAANDIMTTPALSIREHADMRAVIAVLQTNHLIRVPVVDREGLLVGIVSRRDVLQAYLGAHKA